jgi:hypothetical protein
MQFIFFVPPNEELEGTLHPQQFWCTPKNEGKRVHVPPDEKNLWAGNNNFDPDDSMRKETENMIDSGSQDVLE